MKYLLFKNQTLKLERYYKIQRLPKISIQRCVFVQNYALHFYLEIENIYMQSVSLKSTQLLIKARQKSVFYAFKVNSVLKFRGQIYLNYVLNLRHNFPKNL